MVYIYAQEIRHDNKFINMVMMTLVVKLELIFHHQVERNIEYMFEHYISLKSRAEKSSESHRSSRKDLKNIFEIGLFSTVQILFILKNKCILRYHSLKRII